MARQKGFKNPNAGRRKIPLIIEVPPKEIILDQIFYWIDLQATQEEIAGSFRVSVETLNSRIIEHFGMNFSELRKRCEGAGKLSLRRYQFEQAKKNASMAIWLGKQWLGQKDHEEVNKDSPKMEDIELKNRLYAALYEIQQLRIELDALKPKASEELQRSNPQV